MTQNVSNIGSNISISCKVMTNIVMARNILAHTLSMTTMAYICILAVVTIFTWAAVTHFLPDTAANCLLIVTPPHITTKLNFDNGLNIYHVNKEII